MRPFHPLLSLLDSLLPRLTVSQTLKCIRLLYWLPGLTKTASYCPVCGAKPDRIEFNAPFSALDHCPDCGHVFSRKIPGKVILYLMYRDLDYWTRDKVHQGITKIEYGPQWKVFLDARIGVLKRVGAIDDMPKRLFEIGCSEGILLRELGNLGHQALGCECNGPTAKAGMQALGVDIRVGLFEEIDLPQAHFDVVASFHTVEHIPDLRPVFEKIADTLTQDGVALIEVPTGPEEYANTDHVHFFSHESLKRLMEKYFEVGEVLSNQYANAEGTLIGSFYGVGRRPKRKNP